MGVVPIAIDVLWEQPILNRQCLGGHYFLCLSVESILFECAWIVFVIDVEGGDKVVFFWVAVEGDVGLAGEVVLYDSGQF